MTTSNDPEAIRRDIERTQRELSYDVDALNEKVNPSRVVDRRVSAAKGRVSRVKDRVMGSAHDTRATAQYRAHDAAGTVQDRAQGAAGTVQDAAQQAAHAVQQAPDTIVRQAQAGLQPPAGLGEGAPAGPAGRGHRSRAQGRAPRPGQAGRAGGRRAAEAGRAAGGRGGQVHRAGRRPDRQERGPVRRAGRPGPGPAVPPDGAEPDAQQLTRSRTAARAPRRVLPGGARCAPAAGPPVGVRPRWAGCSGPPGMPRSSGTTPPERGSPDRADRSDARPGRR
jgi:hypothetical protein